MAMALKKQRRRQHAKFVKLRNREQGHTGGPDSRGKKKPVGLQVPSYHKPPAKIEILSSDRPVNGLVPHLVHCDEVELMSVSITITMTPHEHAEYKAQAKAKKKGFQKFVEREGWTLVQGGDKDTPADWSRSV